MSWTLIFVLTAAAYGFKAFGLLVVGERPLPARAERCLALLPAALIAAIAAHDTFVWGDGLRIDARLAGVAVALIAAWRHAPFVLVVVLAAGTTAGVRALG